MIVQTFQAGTGLGHETAKGGGGETGESNTKIPRTVCVKTEAGHRRGKQIT